MKIARQRINLLIVSGFAFTIGNVIWDKWGLENWEHSWKLMYVPLAFFLSLLLWNVIKPIQKSVVQTWFINYFIALSISNIVKQIFYDPTMKQINDYVVGGLSTLILLIFLIIRWVTQRQANGGKV